MAKWLRALAFIGVLVVCLGAAATGVVTGANLLERERDWPYRVALTEAWQPPGRDAPLPAGEVGVLIRVEPGGVARVDFARDGKFEVPVSKTDLVANANRVLRGELEKASPNFVFTIAHHRLVDAESEPPAALPPEKISDRKRFLCVFSDPRAASFAGLAGSLRPLSKRSDVATIFFPQGKVSNAEILDRLHANDWTVPFLYEHLSEPYTRTLLSEGTPMPYLMLVTDEGRVLFRDVWQRDALAQLQAALDAGNTGR